VGNMGGGYDVSITIGIICITILVYHSSRHSQHVDNLWIISQKFCEFFYAVVMYNKLKISGYPGKFWEKILLFVILDFFYLSGWPEITVLFHLS
jgi:hypothetical protein